MNPYNNKSQPVVTGEEYNIRLSHFVIILILILEIVSPSVLSTEEISETQIITSGHYDKGFRYNIQGWVYIHLEGEPYKRGYQYGYLASAEIMDVINRWCNWGHNVLLMKSFVLKNLPKNYDKLSEKWWEICKTQSMKFFEKHIPEEYKQEMKGMVDGLNAREVKLFGRNVEYEDIVASQFVQDVQYAFIKYSFKRLHPIRNILYSIKEILSGDANDNEIGHCRAIIATGNATANGEIIIAHATIFEKYIAERCNFIVDIKPSQGYRFIMTSPPGSLWSQEDYYENEKGIVLTETELIPQGSFNIRKIPKGVRSRTAIQYSASIDEVIQNLQNGNNGLIPNEWLIGDTKTGEIARLEQALYNTPVIRTKNGVFTSSNFPHNNQVERELRGIFRGVIKSKLLPNTYPNKYTYSISNKFNELEKQYYGKIDIDIVKKILTTFPISESSTDIKISNSNLLQDLGLIAYFGRPVGEEWIPHEDYITRFKGVTELPPSGWVDIYPSQSNPITLPLTKKTNSEKNNSKVLWEFATNSLGNTNYSSNIVDEGIVYTGTSSGIIYAIKNDSHKIIWSKNIGEKSTEPVIYDDLLYIGTNNGLQALNKETGELVWEQLVGNVISKPVICGNIIIASFSNNEIHAFDLDSGNKTWSFQYTSPAYISEINENDIMYVGSGESCFGFDINKKEIIWESKTSGPITASPKISDGTVFIGSWDGDLYALDATSGELKWKYETGWGIDSTPAVSDEIVFVGSLDNNFYALNEGTGTLKWFYTCNAAIHSSPCIYGEYVFFGCDDGRIYALNKTNGDLIWSYSPRYAINETTVNNFITTPILSNPFVKDGVVYFGANGRIYALDAQTFETQKEFSKNESDNNYGMVVLVGIIVIIVMVIIFLFVRIKGKNDNNEKNKSNRLKRSLSVWEVTLMGVGSILGAGIYIVIGEAAGLSGNSLWLSFILAAILAIFTGLSYAELSSRFPQSGAEYVYIENSFGKTAAWLVGWLILVGSIIGGTAVAIGFSYYFSAIFGTPILLTAIFMLFVIGLILIIGIQETASITIIFTFIEAAGLIIIIFIGIPYFGSVNYFELTKGVSGLINASILIFFSYIGFEGISRLAEETKNPEKNIPKAIIYSIIIVTIVYALVGIAALSIVGWQELSTAKAPLATIAEKVFGENSFILLSVIALFATFNTVLFILLSGSRLVYGMAEQQALPSAFLRVSKKLRTPWVAIIGIVISSMGFLYLEDLTTLANLTNFAIITVFILVNASVIYYRYKKPSQNGFRIPLSIGKLPVIPFIGIVLSFFMIINLSIIVLLYGIILICLGVIINFFWKWKH